ncbi:hypothetical protein SAMN05518849_11376 [Sphingobium sp. AP50]|uniref:hypothetical protein n=1 Tax=Sphingobium sp. AP50 TaxID=1884369 RepID=UPI0008C15F5D|nr:hypothetical protein [Sphingobium sp. AP50]SEJ77007.1 hypothetical protein SAMN05518849_11376 [Sphingobium sp. AP50]
MDRGIIDATNEQIIGYIDDCSPVEPHPIEVNLHFENAEEAIAMVEALAQLLRDTKKQFITDIQQALSTTALDRAYVFKHSLSLQDALMVSIEKHDLGRWGKMRQFDHYTSQA